MKVTTLYLKPSGALRCKKETLCARVAYSKCFRKLLVDVQTWLAKQSIKEENHFVPVTIATIRDQRPKHAIGHAKSGR